MIRKLSKNQRQTFIYSIFTFILRNSFCLIYDCKNHSINTIYFSFTKFSCEFTRNSLSSISCVYPESFTCICIILCDNIITIWKRPSNQMGWNIYILYTSRVWLLNNKNVDPFFPLFLLQNFICYCTNIVYKINKL